jgi:mRNA interferase MazF
MSRPHIAKEILRGDIYHADLDPIVGSEQGGSRPVLIISNNSGNHHSPTVIVAAITSKEKPRLPTHLPLGNITGLHPRSIALLEQLRTIDKTRFGGYVTTLDNTAMRLVDAVLAVSLGIRLGREAEQLITLCRACKANYEDAGFMLRLASDIDGSKEMCDFCNYRSGFTYEVGGA